MKKYKVTLTKEERDEIDAISSKGKQTAQNVLNALILLACDEGPFQKERSINETISRVLNVSMKTIDRVKKRFVEEGLDEVMTRKPTSRVYERKADGDLEAHLRTSSGTWFRCYKYLGSWWALLRKKLDRKTNCKYILRTLLKQG